MQFIAKLANEVFITLLARIIVLTYTLVETMILNTPGYQMIFFSTITAATTPNIFFSFIVLSPPIEIVDPESGSYIAPIYLLILDLGETNLE